MKILPKSKTTFDIFPISKIEKVVKSIEIDEVVFVAQEVNEIIPSAQESDMANLASSFDTMPIPTIVKRIIQEEVDEEIFFDGVIDISEEEYEGLLAGTHCFNNSLTAVVLWKKTKKELAKEQRNRQIEALNNEIVMLKAQLAESDYLAIKYIEGEVSEGDYAQVKAKRKDWRNDINEKQNEIDLLNS